MTLKFITLAQPSSLSSRKIPKVEHCHLYVPEETQVSRSQTKLMLHHAHHCSSTKKPVLPEITCLKEKYNHLPSQWNHNTRKLDAFFFFKQHLLAFPASLPHYIQTVTKFFQFHLLDMSQTHPVLFLPLLLQSKQYSSTGLS